MKRLIWLPLLFSLLVACSGEDKNGQVSIEAASTGLDGVWHLDFNDSLAANLDQGEDAFYELLEEVDYDLHFDLEGRLVLGRGTNGDHLLALSSVAVDGNRYTLSAGDKTYQAEVLGNGRALLRYKGFDLVLERPWTNPGDRELRGLAGAWKVESSSLALEDGSFVQITQNPEMLIYFGSGFERNRIRPYRSPAGEFKGFVTYLGETFCLASLRDPDTIEVKNARGEGLLLKKHLLDAGAERLNGLWEVNVEETLRRIPEAQVGLLEDMSESCFYADSSFPGALSVNAVGRGQRAYDGFARLDPLVLPLEVVSENVYDARFDRLGSIRLRLLEDGQLLVSEVKDYGDGPEEEEVCLLRRVGK